MDTFLQNTFPYCTHFSNLPPSIGKSYNVGNSKTNSVKLDIYYTDTFIQSPMVIDDIRIATIDEIIAMKVDVVQRGGRKKDFWDLHHFINQYSFKQMLMLHLLRYPYNHEAEIIKANFSDFTHADDDFDPICLKGNYWEFIKEDLKDFVD
ncbi:nucleotidyl transferase AbiEii/AbiGii toxin family protein [Myroides profundi]